MLDMTAASASGSVVGAKRKTADGDDEVEIVEGPTIASGAKKVKGKPRAKNR